MNHLNSLGGQYVTTPGQASTGRPGSYVTAAPGEMGVRCAGTYVTLTHTSPSPAPSRSGYTASDLGAAGRSSHSVASRITGAVTVAA